MGDRAAGTARADDERALAGERYGRPREAVDAADAIEIAADPAPVGLGPDRVDGADLLPVRLDGVEEIENRDLVRHRDDDAVEVADGAEADEQIREVLRRDVHREQHSLRPEPPEGGVERAGRADLGDGIADDRIEPRFAGERQRQARDFAGRCGVVHRRGSPGRPVEGRAGPIQYRA